MDKAECYRGSLLGLAAVDALGVMEFRPPGTFEPVEGMRGGGPHRLEAGYWTDTSPADRGRCTL